MLKERIQEILEFTKSESPYRKANKGWINQDIFLDLNPSPEDFNQKNEAAKLTLLWSPINSLIANIFLILIISSLLVFTSLSFAKGRFDLSIFNTSQINYQVKVDENKLKDLNAFNSKTEEELDINDQEKSSKINSSDNISINMDQKIIIQKPDEENKTIKDIESNQDIRILKNNKSKSNFI
ncbi:hypothetical protein [Prochlorococcus marinus]|uniref:Uncharacterized protein n=1 Tax=Prochlorococcus marinus XMU1408 TaxID=2213228 RepID=A0A318QXI9_PROMR|nr:hypothetical protein [Prochlorococcus marinus]MBW3042740.1 hypothetical protein [Prochlorococcus marinus str. XMU1408]PYE01426.1 hypothetical protein DNJ73_08455 [Prochlorococcus marinus XMU1408]